MPATVMALESVEPLQPRRTAVAAAPRFVIGRTRRGGWVLNDKLGVLGGFFISETAARHFVEEHFGKEPDQITVLGAAGIDMDFSRAS